MKVYTIERTQTLPILLSEAWDFFSSPKNLSAITPAYMNFEISYQSGEEKMYAGQIIHYRVNVLPLIRLSWITEITHVSAPYFFVDEQRHGPYKLWHHQHHFTETDGGVKVDDVVSYALPFGFIGRATHALFVKQQLNAIFDHRNNVLNTLFNKRAIRKLA